MGIALGTQAKSFDNTKYKVGKKPSKKDPVNIQVTSTGFIPSDITVFSGQVIQWEWVNTENSETQHNIKQVALSESGQPVPVPNGLCSGHLCPAGYFEVEIVAPGAYYFISEGHSSLRTTTIKVLAAPQETVKVTDQKFEPDFVEINEGECITWKWESGKGSFKRVEYCSKHGGVTFSNLNPTCSPEQGNTYTYTETFEKPGIYYFTGESQEQLCIIKVLQTAREHSINFLDNRTEPSFINGLVGDRIWVRQVLTKKNDRLLVVKAEDGAILVSSRPRGTSKPDRCPSLISYCFALPGIYRVECVYGLSTLQCIVLVQPKPRDYVIRIGPQGFEPELGSVKQDDRIWWMWTAGESDKRGFLIEEQERIAAVSQDFLGTRETDCKCLKSNGHLLSIGQFGLLSKTADTPGLFTYRVKAIGDWSPPNRDVCSIIVQNVAKNHIVRVRDHSFQPQIVNVHPGESVTWTWCDTNNSHSIQQVSHERVPIDDGFHSNYLSPSPDAVSHVFTDLGVFYFTSANLSAVYGAVVVTAGNQVHKVEVTLHGIDPDPLGVRVGDIVCWRWSSDQLYSINAMESPDEIDKIVKTQDIPIQRRCVAATFKTTGIYHFACTAYISDEDQPEIHACDSFINTVYVDPAPYSCRVKVSRDGFQPHTVTLAKHESVLWSWESIPNEQHNILLIENPYDKDSIAPARGPAFFESGPLTSRSSFFHTFDTPGSYWVTSHGTDGKFCRIDVLDEAKRVMSPTITNGGDGGNVELGYTVFLSCVDRDVDILYTLDGSTPVENLPNSKVYNWQEGIRLSQAGLYLVRAIATKAGWIPSDIFTSRRFWVFTEEEVDVAEEQSTEDNLELRQEITNWQWASCAPNIASTFIFDNVIRIDFTLSPNAQPSWIAGFQLFLNGQPYGGWLCASCPGVEVSGLTGGKIYHVVIVVFPAQEEFSPQLSNDLIIKCPAVSSFGGPIISLETCDRVDAVVIVWPANHDSIYTLLVDDQPMGEQISAEPDNDYCRVLFETENADEERTFSIMAVIGDNPQLVSNEIQFSLPLPIEIIQPTGPKLTQQGQEAPTSEDTNASASPSNVSKELLIVSEFSVAVMPSRPDDETLSPDPLQFQSTLDTIHEDKQLDVVTPPPRPSSSEYTKQVIKEEIMEQLEVDEQDKRDNGNQIIGDLVGGAKLVEESGDKGLEGVHHEDGISEEQDAHKQNKDGTSRNEMGSGEIVDNLSALQEDNDDNKLKKVHPDEHDLHVQDNRDNGSQDACDGIMNSFVESVIYGPLEEYSNNTDILEWEYVSSWNCDYHVDVIDEDSEHTNDRANVFTVECEEARTKTIPRYSDISSNVAKSSLHLESGDEVEFYSCEIGDAITVESPWCEYYGMLKEIESFEGKISIVEHSLLLCNAMVQNKMILSADDDISSVVEDLQILQGTSYVGKEGVSVCDQKTKDSDKNKGISLESSSDNKKILLKEEETNTEDYEKDESPFVIRTQSCSDLTLSVKGTSQSKVILEWDDKCGIDSPVYYLMVFGEKFTGEVDSQYRYFKNSPTPDIWPNNQASIEQHCWSTEHNVIEIRGLKPRYRYRIAVVIMPHDITAKDSSVPSSYGVTSLRSEILTFTMPGRPKAPVIYVTALRDRELTISWRPSCSYGDARVVGYRLLVNGKQHGELLPHDAIHHTLSELQYGTFVHISLVAVTRHDVGDSTHSNVVTIACPHPPPPPEIREAAATSPHSICITWSAVTTTIDPDQLKLLSSYDVFVDDVFHGSCPAGDVADIFMDSFTYTIPGCIAGREYSVKVKGHVDPQAIESSQPAHMCGCYGDPSNTLLVRCLEASSGPVLRLRVESIDESAAHLSWDKPLMYGARHITGYILVVNGRNHGNIIDPDIQTTKLQNPSLGNDIEVALLALTNTDAIGDVGRQGHQGQIHLEIANDVDAQTQEPHDSGVESSSSVFVDKQSATKLQSAPITLHLWGFVRRVCDVQIKQVCCCSALVQWNLQEDEEMSQGRRHDVFIDPEAFKVKCWKSEELAAQELEPIETSNLNLRLNDLTPLSRYGVVIEAFAQHPNYTENSTGWNVSRSDKIWFDTKPLPDFLQDVRVVFSTVSSICLGWDLPGDNGSIKNIELSVYKKYNGDCDDGGDCEDMTSSSDAFVHLVINSHMTSYTVHNLDPQTMYVFTLKTLYTYTDTLNDSHCCGEAVSLEACTSGVDRPRDLHVIKLTPFSIHVAWKPAVAYGDIEILYYLVHCTEKKTKASQGVISDNNYTRVPHGSAMGPQTIIHGLEPGVVYSIAVEAVVGLRDKDVEEGEEEDKRVNDNDEVESSIGSSESDWMSALSLDCISKPLTVSTVAPPGIPVLFVTGISATQIHLAWNKPVALQLDSEDQNKAERQECRGRVRQISGYSLEVNGRVVTRLPPEKHNFSLKRCKPGMKYTCYLVVITTACDSGSGKRNKKTDGLNNKQVTAVNNTELDSDDEADTSFQESRSEPLEVTIPRQDHPLAVNINYSPTCGSHVSSVSSSGSEESSDDGCVVMEWKASPALKGVASYEVTWKNTLDEGSEDTLLSSSNCYEIYPVKQRSLYTVWLKMLRRDGSSISWGPFLCQVPGRPSPPWIWCRSVSPHRILVEWNEPEMYGVDTIRAYQVNLNGRQLGKLLSPQSRKVAVHCQPSSVYRIVLLALSTDPNLGGSDPSNLLTICTPGVKDKSLDPKQNIRIKPLWAENDSITVEWSDDNDLLTVDHYVIKWSSVLHPQSTERTVSVDQVSYTIEDCKSGTRHFIAVAAVDDRGKLISKSPQLTVQTSAPLTAPKPRLSFSLPSSIQVEWDRPTPMGDATVHAYDIKVNDVVRATVDSGELCFEWKDCTPCAIYDFQIKVISTKDHCHSNWSEVLSVTCPGALIPVITRAPSNHINAIHVAWDTPDLVGGATVDSYKVHYLMDEEADLTNDSIVNNPSTITHGPLHHSAHEDTLDNALPTLPYWVALEVNLLPEGCITVFSQPIRTKVAVSPDPPQIRVDVIGLNERQALERFVCGLSQIKDRICLKLQSLQNSVVVKGSKQKETQICKNFATIRNLEVELKNCTQDIKDLTGLVNANITWSLPRDDSDAIVTGYQVYVDGEEHGTPLDKDVLSTCLELPASSHDHVIFVKTLTNHPIGHSGPSNTVTVCAKDFLPFVQFCYFDVHSESKGCCYDQSIAHETQNKLISTHRGSLGKPLPSPVCNVTDVVEDCTKPLLTSDDKPRAILFWTIWCHSSIKAMEMFIQFTNEYSHQLDFTTCCVNSGQPVSGHHQSLYHLLSSRGWLGEATNVQHTCGCHADNHQPFFQRSVGRGQKSGVSHMFGLVGVPTIMLCNKEGYIIWQGRCCIQDYMEYQQFMCHALNEASNQSCTVTNCTQCSLDHELNTMDTNGPSSRVDSDPSDCFSYKKTKHDSSLEVTGRLSRLRQKKLSLVYNNSTDETGLTGLTREDGKPLVDRTSFETLHPSLVEDTENLHRRLHGTRLNDGTSPQLETTPQSKSTHPQTTQSTSRNHTRTSQNTSSSKSPKSVRFLGPERSKSAAYQTRTSVFKNRFSSSMASTLPSLPITNDRTQPKIRNRSASSKQKQKISVDKFSPI